MKFLMKLMSILDGSSLIRNYIKRHLAHDDCDCTLIDAGAAGGVHHRWGSGLDNLRKKQFDPSFKTNYEIDGSEQIPFALASKDGSLTIRVNSKPETSSKFAPNIKFLRLFDAAERFETLTQVSVPSVTLESQISSSYWFGKFDVQGMELEVLEGAGASLRKCIGMEVEVEFSEIYLEQPLMADVYSFLRDQGFEFIDFLALYRWEKPKQGGPGQLIFADALFMRAPEKVAVEESDCAAKLYTAVCLNYGRLDLIERLVGIKTSLHDSELKRLLKNISRRFSMQKVFAKWLQIAMRPILRGPTVYIIR